MTDTADQNAPAAHDDQPQPTEEAPEELLAEPLEMPAPGPAPAGFRFPTDAELMDGPNPLTDPDDEEDGEDEPGDDSDGEDDDSDGAIRLDADGFPVLDGLGGLVGAVGGVSHRCPLRGRGCARRE